ncbi:hypothetical protein E5288_WYG018833 [Bos mutus]|uniref:Uncharacterized protein n=1 Tax=Bos mutus TaxID=72004 RepID=A0A6B0R6T9_9CETA|nr:hypothetical protein [Bos mutus]
MTEAQNGMRDFDYNLMYKRERRRALEKRCSRQEVQYMQSQRKRKTRMKQLTTTGKRMQELQTYDFKEASSKTNFKKTVAIRYVKYSSQLTVDNGKA